MFDRHGIDVFIGVDIAKGDHYAQVITVSGDEVRPAGR